MELIDKIRIEVEKKTHREQGYRTEDAECGYRDCAREILSFLDTLEVKEVDLMIHTIIVEYCDWLAMNTNLSHDEIEGCRNLMLTVKEEQLKAQKGE